MQSGPDTDTVREDWARRGRHWDRRADETAENAKRVNAPLIEAADIAPGQKVLDLATGAGEPMLTVAEMVGPGGSVVASDLVPEMLASARRRTADKGLDNISFRIGDMSALPDEDGTYDRVICRFGLMFVEDASRALSEAHRVLKPGGRAAYMVWGPRDDTTMFTVFAEAADAVWGLDDPLIDLDTMCRMGEPGTLTDLLSNAGFEAVEEREKRFSPRLPGDQAFWHPQIDLSLGPKMDIATEAEKDEMLQRIRDGFARTLVDGEYRITAHVRVGTGVKSGG